jgi:ABC-type Fe3+ transport system substrate-binding protein
MASNAAQTAALGFPEGERIQLVIDSAAEPQYCAGLLQGFRSRHPAIEIDFRFAISTDLHARHLEAAAAGRPTADLVWSSAMDLQMGLVRDGEALPHAVPNAAGLPPGAAFRDEAYSTTLEPLATLVDADALGRSTPAGSPAEITRLLADEPSRFRGRVACCDIERNGLAFLALLHAGREQASLAAFLAALSRCEPILVPSVKALADLMVARRALLGWPVLGSYARRAVASAPHLAIAPSGAPCLAVSRVALVPRQAAQPAAGKLFLDYLLSPEGQRHLGEAGLFPITGPGAADADLLRIDDGFADYLDPARRRNLSARWAAATGRPAGREAAP